MNIAGQKKKKKAGFPRKIVLTGWRKEMEEMERLGQHIVSLWVEKGFCIFTAQASYEHPRAPESWAESWAMRKCRAVLLGQEEEEEVGSPSCSTLCCHLTQCSTLATRPSSGRNVLLSASPAAQESHSRWSGWSPGRNRGCKHLPKTQTQAPIATPLGRSK